MEGNFYRVMAVDPGLDKFGVAILDYYFDTNEIKLTHTETVNPVAGMKRFPEIEARHGARLAKYRYHEEYWLDALEKWEPHSVAHETSFLGKFANSFSALTEAILILKATVVKYNMLIDVDGIDPPTVKKSVGTPAKTKDKTLVMEAIKCLDGVAYTDENKIDLEFISEHAADAVAIGFWRMIQFIKN